MYALSGETRSDGKEERRDVHCLRASLSEHDLERVGGLSARAVLALATIFERVEYMYLGNLQGFLLTKPSWEKDPRPNSPGGESSLDTVTGQGVASSCASITNSMLASPHGASEQYIMILDPSWRINGCCPEVPHISAFSLHRSIGDS